MFLIVVAQPLPFHDRRITLNGYPSSGDSDSEGERSSDSEDEDDPDFQGFASNKAYIPDDFYDSA